MGKCPECGMKIGPVSIIKGWDNWGKFTCPSCGNQIRFRNWLFAVVVLIGLFVAAERFLHFLLVTDISLGLSFLISTVVALMIMMIVPMIWEFKKINDENET